MFKSTLKKRTKLLLAASAMAGATALAVSNLPASAAGQGQNFVLISNHSVGTCSCTVEIEEHAADGTVLQKANPGHSAFYYIDGQTAYVTVRRESRTVTIPGGAGPNNNVTLNQNTDLPQCLRLSGSGELHVTTQQQPCNTDGVSQGTWN